MAGKTNHDQERLSGIYRLIWKNINALSFLFLLFLIMHHNITSLRTAYSQPYILKKKGRGWLLTSYIAHVMNIRQP